MNIRAESPNLRKIWCSITSNDSVFLRVFRSLLIFLFLLNSISVSAQRIQYDCRGCTLSEDDKTKFRIMSEYETQYFSDIFGNQRTQTIRIRVFGDEARFKSAQRKIIGRVISETGMYAPVPKLVMIFKSPRYLATTYHEMSHAIFHHHARWRPTWLDEGIAEYFKTATIDSLENVTIGPHIYRLQEMRRCVADSLTFTILPVIAASNRQFHMVRETSYYTISWAIVYYLRTFHDDLFSDILYKIGTGKGSKKTLEAEYPGGIKQLEKDMVRYYINTQ